MKLHFGSIPSTEGFVAGGSWKPLREPGPAVMQLYALPLGMLTCAVFVVLWVSITPVTKAPVASVPLMSIAMLATFPIHELLHAVVHPHFGMSSKSIIGCWLSRMLFYAHYTDAFSRNRFIAVLLMPLLVLSVVPLLVCSAMGHASVTVAFASAFNALAAGGDVFAVCLLLVQVPRKAMVCNQGYATYWTTARTA